MPLTLTLLQLIDAIEAAITPIFDLVAILLDALSDGEMRGN
jgi:hypothetical protein